MQRATINHLSSETALPNRSRIAECRRKSQNIVALAGFASGRAPAVREPAAFIFCLPIPPVWVARFASQVERVRDEDEWRNIEERAARRDLASDEEVEALFSRYCNA